MPRAIQRSSDFYRIAALPRRDVSSLEQLAAAATAELRTLGGTMDLWGIQGAMLVDFFRNRGLLAPVKVSGGKTLVSLLAPTVVDAKRPLLLVPAKLIKKTKRAIAALSYHFRIKNYIRILSYEKLGRIESEKDLENYHPDLIIADECHKLKNQKAGVTRRVKRYITANREVMFMGLSGTISRRSLRDYAHLHLWSARHSDQYCLPFSYHDLDDWACVLDTKPPRIANQNIEPGALLDFAEPEDFDPDPQVTARRGYRRRFQSTQGIVCSSNVDDLACSLIVQDELVSTDFDCSEIDTKIKAVRRTWSTPEGYALSFAPQVWQHVTQMSLGFYYRFKVRPPDSWFAARKEWAQFVRAEIDRQGSRLDTEFAVAQAFPDCDELTNWRIERLSFPVQKEAVWFSDAVLQHAAQWLRGNPRGLCWVDYIEFGDALSALTGIPYFREEATSREGIYLPDHNGPAICSIKSCSEGLDLQFKWDSNLFVCPTEFGSSNRNEQALGRTHRFGQEADTVTATWLINCIENAEALQSCMRDVREIMNREGTENKLLYCDLAIEHTPETLIHLPGGRWAA